MLATFIVSYLLVGLLVVVIAALLDERLDQEIKELPYSIFAEFLMLCLIWPLYVCIAMKDGI